MQKIIERIKKEKIVAILRLGPGYDITAIVNALLSGGLPIIEVIVTTPNVFSSIVDIVREFGDQCAIGTGSVLNLESLDDSLKAGAQFIVTPNLNAGVIERAHKNNVAVLAGAFTPSELYNAHDMGCKLIKVFPTSSMGPNYIKSVKAPMPYLSLMPTGGVTLENVNEWFLAGADAVGIGSSLLSGFEKEKKNYDTIIKNAMAFRTKINDNEN